MWFFFSWRRDFNLLFLKPQKQEWCAYLWFGFGLYLWGFRSLLGVETKSQSEMLQFCKGLEPGAATYIFEPRWSSLGLQRIQGKGSARWLFVFNSCCPLAGGGVTVLHDSRCVALTSAFVTAACKKNRRGRGGGHVLMKMFAFRCLKMYFIAQSETAR